MSITDTLIKQISAAALPALHAEPAMDDQLPEVDLLPADLFNDAPGLEVFRRREPDSDELFPEQPDGLAVLGTYRWMHSPGLITLYRGNIETYWKSLLRHAQRQYPYITRKDAERVLQLLVLSVYQHERLHYVGDFCRRLLGGHFDRWHEEALAVAWEWHWLRGQDRWNSFYGMLHPTLRRLVVQTMFDHQSPGYRDWRQFANHAAFLDALNAYLYPAGAQTFGGTRFDFAAWALAHVPDDANPAWEEQILP